MAAVPSTQVSAAADAELASCALERLERALQLAQEHHALEDALYLRASTALQGAVRARDGSHYAAMEACLPLPSAVALPGPLCLPLPSPWLQRACRLPLSALLTPAPPPPCATLLAAPCPPPSSAAAAAPCCRCWARAAPCPCAPPAQRRAAPLQRCPGGSPARQCPWRAPPPGARASPPPRLPPSALPTGSLQPPWQPSPACRSCGWRRARCRQRRLLRSRARAWRSGAPCPPPFAYAAAS